ncbi:NAD(P)/FAD-dependent oxidoreductase [Cryobacterium sp. W22_MBD10_FK3]|uniref:NAD(P)/FAD-dependent oxidoreductase n=1 Tax=Cryobacterium sp. W22_MBD10_FK3 TaxID=3240273 RepID=UPI003F922E5D
MRRIVIIGAGIVGSSLAAELASDSSCSVTVLERDAVQPQGSTAYAPGFVGLYNDAPVLTNLARASTHIYDTLGEGFVRAGGLELAVSTEGAAALERRAKSAMAAGLRVAELSPTELPASVSHFVDTTRVIAAWHCLDDAVAHPATLADALRERATTKGAHIVSGASVVGIDAVGSGYTVTTADGQRFLADDVVLAGGVWGPTLADMVDVVMPLIPVAHPYVYGPHRASFSSGPFVRWPELHVYARVHLDRLGLGSYDHAPIPVEQEELGAGAGLAWRDELDAVINSAQSLLRAPLRFAPEKRVNGVFAMTPDNLPFLGLHPSLAGVWIAQALWVTHAAGAARALTDAILSGSALPPELRPDRFDGRPPVELRESALRLYRDIYANDAE